MINKTTAKAMLAVKLRTEYKTGPRFLKKGGKGKVGEGWASAEDSGDEGARIRHRWGKNKI